MAGFVGSMRRVWCVGRGDVRRARRFRLAVTETPRGREQARGVLVEPGHGRFKDLMGEGV